LVEDRQFWLSRIEAAQKKGSKLPPNMYTYTAAGTGSMRVLPPGLKTRLSALFKRLRDPATREKIKAQVQTAHRLMGNLVSGMRRSGAHSGGRLQVGKTKAVQVKRSPK